MKHLAFVFLGCLGLLGSLQGCSQSMKETDYTKYVDPFIGTSGHGHTFPGAVYPYGMIQPSPDTRINEWDACSGYCYEDSTINGFSHTHLSGTGCCDYGDVLLMPVVGTDLFKPVNAESQQLSWASPFSHQQETATPGYYSVFLKRYGILAEMTACERGAIHRFTFPKHENSGFIVDLDYSLQNQRNDTMHLDILSDTEIAGYKKTAYWAFDQILYFYAKFSKPFQSKILQDTTVVRPDGSLQSICKAFIHFPTEENEQVLVKVGISAVDAQGAQANVLTEIPAWNFDAIHQRTKSAWNQHLSKIDILTSQKENKTIFYTALYHTGISPNLFSDVDGRYLGMDLKIHQLSPNESPNYTVFSLWDTFRGFHPLLTIINPQLNNQFITSLIRKHIEGGILPMWDLASNYTGTMIGYHAVPVIVDAYMKGNRDFDVAEAYKACLRTAEYDTARIHCPDLVLPHLMPQAKYYKNTIGYIPCDRENESVAKALEYAYDDWCISEFAREMEDFDTMQKYRRFAAAYEFYFDKKNGFMRGLDSKGEWRTPFSPSSSNHRNDDYCEGTAWQWTWFVPHDVPGLIKLMGGEQAFSQKLDSLFIADSALEGESVSVDISGLIGQYAQGNEPSHHIIHLYNYVHQSYKTQELIDQVLQTLYTDQPDGLAGNEDCGQMSAWYVLNSMGFYQVCPGKPIYSIGRPLFNRVKIKLPNQRLFSIITHNNSPKNKYIARAYLNGKELKTPFFKHETLINGGELIFEMTDHPTNWGNE